MLQNDFNSAKQTEFAAGILIFFKLNIIKFHIKSDI